MATLTGKIGLVRSGITAGITIGRSGITLIGACTKSLLILASQNGGFVFIMFGFMLFGGMLVVGEFQSQTSIKPPLPVVSVVKGVLELADQKMFYFKPLDDQLESSRRTLRISQSGSSPADENRRQGISQFGFNPSWSDENQRLAFLTIEQQRYTDISIVNLVGDIERITYTADTEYELAWSPDETFLAFTRGQERSLSYPEVWVIHVLQGDMIQIAAPAFPDCIEWVDDETVAYLETRLGPARQVNIYDPGNSQPYAGNLLCEIPVAALSPQNLPRWQANWQAK